MSATSSTREPSSRASLIRSAVVRSALAACALALALVTAVWPDWIERTAGLELDAGSGVVEWLIVGTVGVIAVAAIGGAGAAWRRVALAP
jgi:hypothetical protein